MYAYIGMYICTFNVATFFSVFSLLSVLVSAPVSPDASCLDPSVVVSCGVISCDVDVPDASSLTSSATAAVSAAKGACCLSLGGRGKGKLLVAEAAWSMIYIVCM